MSQVEKIDTNKLSDISQVTDIEFLSNEQTELNNIQKSINFENGFKIDLPIKINNDEHNIKK